MTRDALVIHSVPTMTHGRVLVVEARAAAARGLMVGFHGYGENAGIQMERLQAIPGAAAWTLVSVQALHRFYDRRAQQVIACWMTHEDREDAIADNLAYVTAALEGVPYDPSRPVVFAGFSQGVAMAYRAACRGPRRAAGIITVGGDVPPELLQEKLDNIERKYHEAGAHYVIESIGHLDEAIAEINARLARGEKP